jgi:hypothetical protein
MSNLMTTIFGPLSKDSCLYFFILTVICFVTLVFVLLTELYFIVMNYNKLNLKSLQHGVLILCNVFIAYFVNRLFYTMCAKSLA